LETVLTVLHAGGKFGDSGYTVSAGLHGVGVSVVNALSESMDVSVRRDGKLHSMSFAKGKVERDIEVMPLESGSSRKSGTKVTFRPDDSIFKAGICFDFDTLATRFDEQAYLNAGLNITLHDERDSQGLVETGADANGVPANSAASLRSARDAGDGPVDDSAQAALGTSSITSIGSASPSSRRARSRVFCHEGGIAEYVEHICETKKPLFEDPSILTVTANLRGVAVDVAMRWNADMYSDSILSFANGVHTPQGGSHIDGLKAAATRVLNAQARLAGKLKEKAPNLAGEFLREGLCAIVSVKMSEAEFEGQTKSRLGNPEVRSIVGEVVSDALAEFMQRRPKALAAIIDKASAAAKAAEAAKAARDLVRRKTVLGTSVLPGKLADCSSTDPAESEVFIVEGDSAGGSAKQGRRRDTQAILPLRGKILNVEKSDDAAMYGNNEIQALITALGLGIKGEDFQPKQLRYHRIILMTDADVDGAHIRTLLLTFLYRYQRALITEGYVYIAYPPLYKVRHRQRTHYCYSDGDLRQLLEELGGKPTTQRFKGLGEMMPQELWSTTMDPSTRRLKRVTAEDAAEADRLLSVLMGNNIAPRKAFITEQAETLDWSLVDV
jgi:DNA gyrase subunit B